MAQTYTANPYAGGTVVATTMTAANNNFEALRSAFSGATTPANTIAGQWWYDTTAHILKVRNEANTAWLSVWDLANNKPIITNLSAEITLAMMAASTKSPAAGTEGLRKLGTGALDAMAGNATPTPADGSVTEGKLGAGAVTVTKIGNAAVTLAKLKTSTSEVSTWSADGANLTLTGGQYCHYPQLKNGFWNGGRTVGASYVTTLRLLTPGSGTAYAITRYHTSSGEVCWYFELREKSTGKLISSSLALDHVCFGNGGNPQELQHPFPDYDPKIHDIVLVNPDHKTMTDLESFHSRYEVDENKSMEWPDIPITLALSEVESGLYIPTKQVIQPVDYINVLGIRAK